MRALLLLLLATSLAAADTKYDVVGNQLIVPHPITYGTGTADLKDSDDAIAYVKGYLAAKPYVSTLRIEVHSDSQGADDYNQQMSEKRALAVARALVASGVDCKRLLPVGFGETKPVADNKTATGRAQNRRTWFFNAALRGKAIGGAATDGGGKVAGDPCK